MIEFPFAPVAGQGLGISYSTQTQIGDILPQRSFGQGKVDVFFNVANGNLVIKDHALTLQDKNGAEEFRYIYNSQTGDSAPGAVWRLALPQFQPLPSPTATNQTAVLTEADGHETIYVYDATVNMYFAPGHGQGTPYLRYDDTAQNWLWYHPGTQTVALYNQQGFLQQRIDPQGNQTTYEYQNGLLSAVNVKDKASANNSKDAFGHRYELRRQDSAVEIYEVDSDKNATLLQMHLFDNLGRLTSTQTPSGYKHAYHYPTDIATGALKSIEQSDGTKMTFHFDTLMGGRITGLKAGETNFMDIAYDKLPATAEITDSYGVVTHMALDSQTRVQQITRECGYDTAIATHDITRYGYADSGQVNSIIHPDGSQITSTYNPTFGLKTQEVQADGQVIELIYAQSDRPLLANRIQYLDASKKQAAVQRYVYDTDYDQTGQRHTVLRFEISPEGRVTEYRPDEECIFR